jgi:hypothetical protein
LARRAFLDVYQSRVATALALSGTTLYLDSVDGLAAQDVVIIDDGLTKAEVVFVTAVDTTAKTATVVRGMAGTTDVAHAKGAIVKKVGWREIITLYIPDVSTGETLAILPPKGILVKASTVLGGTIATADAVITLYNKTQAITGGVITIAYSGSALGDIDTCIPTLYNEFDGVDDYLKVVNGGASTNTEPLNIILEFICVED